MLDAQQPPPAQVTGTDGLVRLLHERGRRATPQRLVILRELQRRGRHATADEIRRWTRRELPGTSTPTVYATLELLVELGLARRVDAGSGATLYDPRIQPHQHAVCRRCGRIDDVDGELDVSEVRRRAAETGFAPEAVEIVISGLCAACAAS
ncbi:MAG TPA: transcriptional repressor [Solirubrobacteraceae bacterium]|jgi:Fe2+ or Zn2+ uptake regulation protein|nr:transcriptional repressor [Solirubrobacteraceae bacterium]